ARLAGGGAGPVCGIRTGGFMRAAAGEEIRILLGVTAGLWVICVGPVAWHFRDGLDRGPEWRTSGGLTAVYHSLGACGLGPILGVKLALLAPLSINRTEPRP